MTFSPTIRLVVQRSAGSRRAMSSSAKVWIDKNTRVICQGFTGKQVRDGFLCSTFVAKSFELWNHSVMASTYDRNCCLKRIKYALNHSLTQSPSK